MSQEAARSTSSKLLEAALGAAGLAVLNAVLFAITMVVSEEPGEIPTEAVVAGLFGCIQLLWVVPIAAVAGLLGRGWLVLGVAATAAVTALLATGWLLVLFAMAPVA